MVSTLYRLAAGAYADEHGTLVLKVPELLEAHGLDDTPANRETLVAAARAAFEDLAGGELAVEVVE